MKNQQVGHRSLPEAVELEQRELECAREVAPFRTEVVVARVRHSLAAQRVPAQMGRGVRRNRSGRGRGEHGRLAGASVKDQAASVGLRQRPFEHGVTGARPQPPILLAAARWRLVRLVDR